MHMKTYLLFILFLSTNLLLAQTFTEALDTPFGGVTGSSIAFSDVNGDTYPDVLISGFDSSSVRISKLYVNDGTGSFTELLGTPFEGIIGTIAFSDVNGDSFSDVLITGRNSSDIKIAKLFINDGIGNFTEVIGTPFEGVTGGSIAFSDVNGDMYSDVLVTGLNSSDDPIAKLYINDGTGNFTEVINTPFEGVVAGSIAFSDINGDMHTDVLITGLTSYPDRIAILYTNDGMGNFTEVLDTPFDEVAYNSLAFSDVNSDTYPDILITGRNSSDDKIAKLYTNDGTGNFTEVIDTPFDGVDHSSIAFSDINSDTYPDILITGQDSSYVRIAKLYTSDGLGNFTEVMDMPFEGVRTGSIAFSDVNSDTYPDVLITGQNNLDAPIAKLYINDGMDTSTDETKEESNIHLICFPNPTSNGWVNVRFNSFQKKQLQINLFDINGRLILTQQESVIIGQNNISLDVQKLEKDTYFIDVNDGENKSVLKLLIQ